MKAIIFNPFIFVLSFLLLSQSHSKIPHSHHKEHNGLVLMFGDDHIEFVANLPKNEVSFYASDKFREKLELSALAIDIKLFDGSNTTNLPIKISEKLSHMGTIKLTQPAKKSDVLKIHAFRKSPPKGHLNIKTVQSLQLEKLFNLKK